MHLPWVCFELVWLCHRWFCFLCCYRKFMSNYWLIFVFLLSGLLRVHYHRLLWGRGHVRILLTFVTTSAWTCIFWNNLSVYKNFAYRAEAIKKANRSLFSEEVYFEKETYNIILDQKHFLLSCLMMHSQSLFFSSLSTEALQMACTASDGAWLLA